MRKPTRIGKLLGSALIDIGLAIVFVPLMFYVLRTTFAVQTFLYDFREHGLREIVRAHPSHRRDVILAILNSLERQGSVAVRGFGAGRRYRLRFRPRRRWRLKEKLSEWWNEPVGGPTWAH